MPTHPWPPPEVLTAPRRRAPGWHPGHILSRPDWWVWGGQRVLVLYPRRTSTTRAITAAPRGSWCSVGIRLREHREDRVASVLPARRARSVGRGGERDDKWSPRVNGRWHCTGSFFYLGCGSRRSVTVSGERGVGCAMYFLWWAE
jgi:hypothetical protein